jgi:hypothetical protein
MKNKIAVIASGLSGLLLVLFLMEINYTDCFLLECPPRRDFRVSELGIPAHLFPDDTIVGTFSPSPEVTGAVEDGGMGVFYRNHESLSYLVWRFLDRRDALERFEGNQTNQSLRSLGFASQSADPIFFSCAIYFSGRQTCRFEAVYYEYLVFLRSDLNHQMNYETFLQIVKFVDQQMEENLAE